MNTSAEENSFLEDDVGKRIIAEYDDLKTFIRASCGDTLYSEILGFLKEESDLVMEGGYDVLSMWLIFHNSLVKRVSITQSAKKFKVPYKTLRTNLKRIERAVSLISALKFLLFSLKETTSYIRQEVLSQTKPYLMQL